MIITTGIGSMKQILHFKEVENSQASQSKEVGKAVWN